MRKLMLSIVLLLTVQLADAQSVNIDFEEYDLPNGLHVILHQDNSTPIVATGVMYHVGSKNEEIDKTGFAHFFEHVSFGGSKNIAPGEFDIFVGEAGGTNNAYTTTDVTYYYEIFPSNQLALGLWLESERMLHMIVDSATVSTQREVVKEEKRQRYDNQPYGSFQQEIYAKAYEKHPYRWTPIGSMEHLNNASVQDFIDFRDKFYTPNNAVLTVAGDIDIEATKKLINDYFTDIPAGDEINRDLPVEPKKIEEVRDVVYDEVQLPAVMVAYHVPEVGSKDYYALSMLNKVLSDGQSSRLYKSLVDNKELAVASGAFPSGSEDPGLFTMFAIANMGVEVNLVEKAVLEEVNTLQNELITDEEFNKIRNQVESDFINSKSDVAGIANSLADYYVLYGDTDLINTELDKYLAVTKEDIQQIAKEYLTTENRVLIHWLPMSSQQ